MTVLETFAPRTGKAEISVLPDVASMTAIWARVLNSGPVTPDADFFDLGGDSLLAMGLVLEIERQTGCRIPFTAIYDAPTPEQLLAHLRSEAQTEFSPLVCLKPGHGGTPLFIVHGIGGSVMELAQLAKSIECDGPVYGIQAKGLDGVEQPLTNVDDMADYYCEAIREVQAVGPYQLGGYSFGGLVAMEICRRLQAQKESIGLLLMIDSYAHPKTWPRSTRLLMLGRRTLRRASRLMKQPLMASVRELKEAGAEKLFWRREHSASSIVSQGQGGWLNEYIERLSPELRRVSMAGMQGLKSYKLRPYDGPVTFIRARTWDPKFPFDPRPIWRHIARPLTVRTVHGSHLTMVGEHVSHLAACVSDCLARAAEPLEMTGHDGG